MTRRRLLVLLLALLGPGISVMAQADPVLRDGQSVVSFEGPWRFHPGDDPAWASPDFDDSGWSVITNSKPLAKQGFPEFSGWGWYRIHIHVPHGARPLGVYVPEVRSSYTVYDNGIAVGQFGSGPPAVRRFAGEARAFALLPVDPSATDTDGQDSIVLALRVWVAVGAGVQGMSRNPMMVGDRDLVQALWHREDESYVFNSIGYFVATLFDFLLCAAMLGLFVAQRHRREYLWLGFSKLFAVIAGLLVTLAFASAVQMSWGFYTGDACNLLVYVFAIEFIFAFVRLRPTWYIRAFQAVLVLCAAAGFVSQIFPLFPLATLTIISAPTGLIFMIVLLAQVLPRWLKGKQEAGILLFPALLWAVSVSIEVFNFVAISSGWKSISTAGGVRPHLLPDIYFGPVPIAARAIFDVALDLAFFVVVLHRHTRVSREQARTNAELDAARAVQQVLLPEPGVGLEGFSIEAEYLPAQEVGGDFYQILPTAEGGLLLVVGDVSGKGMPAAMLVAMLVGAIRAEAVHTSDPARLLATLNTRVCGRMSGGFATCAALHLLPDGRAMLSNAANPAPYMNGEEVELSGALPLGMLADVEYENHVLTLRGGDVLTFVSDGIVESQSAASKELFGFERARSMSMKSAPEIAKTAREFGQNDDITVLRVSRSAEAGR